MAGLPQDEHVGKSWSLETTACRGTDPRLTGQAHSQPAMEALGLSTPTSSPKEIPLSLLSLITQPLSDWSHRESPK